MKKLYLDDLRIPKDSIGFVPDVLNQFYWANDWIVVRNFWEFCNYIQKFDLPDFISFDHDLADEHYSMTSDEVNSSSYEEVVGTYQEKTGYDCLKWLVGKVLAPIGAPFPDYALHTMNSIGKDNMEKYINTYKRYVLSGK